MDLKTLNILIDGSLMPRICDFGLSARDDGITHQNNIGTAAIMAPELHRSQPFNHSVDIYSLGMILWEMATGKEPFEGMEPMQIIISVMTKNERPPIPDDMPKPLVSLITRCWDELPHRRPSAHDVFLAFSSHMVAFQGSVKSSLKCFFSTFFPKTPRKTKLSIFKESIRNLSKSEFVFDVPVIPQDVLISALKDQTSTLFPTALDFLEEHIEAALQLGDQLWPLLLPLMTNSRVTKIGVECARHQNVLQKLTTHPNLHLFINENSLDFFLMIVTYLPEMFNSMMIMHTQVLLLKSVGEARNKAVILLLKAVEFTADP